MFEHIGGFVLVAVVEQERAEVVAGGRLAEFRGQSVLAFGCREVVAVAVQEFGVVDVCLLGVQVDGCAQQLLGFVQTLEFGVDLGEPVVRLER